MKFPERLSRERLFLLSKEDRAIYEAEWKDKSVLPESATYDFSTIFEQSEIDSVKENSYVMEQIDYLYQDLFKDIINEDEFVNVAKEIEKQLNENFNKSSQLLEYQGAEGLDQTAWLKNLKLSGLYYIDGMRFEYNIETQEIYQTLILFKKGIVSGYQNRHSVPKLPLHKIEKRTTLPQSPPFIETYKGNIH